MNYRNWIIIFICSIAAHICLFAQASKEDLKAEKEALKRLDYSHDAIKSFITEDYGESQKQLAKIDDKAESNFAKFLNAKIAFNKELYAEAQSIVNDLFQAEKANDVFLQFARDVYISNQNRDGVLRASLALLELKPTDFDYLADVIEIYDNMGKHKAADDYEEKLLNAIGKKEGVALYRVKVLLANENYELAEEKLKTLIEEENSFAGYLELISLYQKKGNLHQSSDLIESLETKYGAITRFKMMKLYQAYLSYENEKCLELAYQIIQQDPSYANAILEFDPLFTYENAKKNPKALEKLLEVIIPDDNNARKYYQSEAVYYATKGEYEKALISTKKQLEQKPVEIKPIVDAISMFYELKQFDAAIELSDFGAEYYPSSFYFPINKGRALLEKKEYAEALEVFEKAKKQLFDFTGREYAAIMPSIALCKYYLSDIETPEAKNTALNVILSEINRLRNNPALLTSFIDISSFYYPDDKLRARLKELKTTFKNNEDLYELFLIKSHFIAQDEEAFNTACKELKPEKFADDIRFLAHDILVVYYALQKNDKKAKEQVEKSKQAYPKQ